MQGISSEAPAWRVHHGFLETLFFIFCKGQFILQTTWLSATSQRQTGSCKPPGTLLKVSRFSQHHVLVLRTLFSLKTEAGPGRPPEQSCGTTRIDFSVPEPVGRLTQSWKCSNKLIRVKIRNVFSKGPRSLCNQQLYFPGHFRSLSARRNYLCGTRWLFDCFP